MVLTQVLACGLTRQAEDIGPGFGELPGIVHERPGAAQLGKVMLNMCGIHWYEPKK